MGLSVRDAARVFGVPEPTIIRWVNSEGLPSFCINGHHRFNRVDLLEWSHLRKHPSSVAGADAASALAAAAERLPLSAADRALAAEVLAGRERQTVTTIVDGTAIPNPRGPHRLRTERRERSFNALIHRRDNFVR